MAIEGPTPPPGDKPLGRTDQTPGPTGDTFKLPPGFPGLGGLGSGDITLTPKEAAEVWKKMLVKQFAMQIIKQMKKEAAKKKKIARGDV